MAMMVTIPPSCVRPPLDPPLPSFLGLMQHCSSSLKMMVTALPSLLHPRPPSDPVRNKHLPIETPPVKPLEPPDPPDVSVSLVLFTSSSSSPQATEVLDLMFNFSRVSSKLSDDGVVLVFTGDTIFVNWRSSPMVYRLYLCQLGNGSSPGSYSNFHFIHLLINVQLKETIIVIRCLVNMVMAGIDCPLGSCLEQSLFPIFSHVWSELDEHVWLVLQGFSFRLTLFPAFSAVVVTLRVTRDAIVQETHETVVMRFLMFTCCDLYFHSILGLSVSYSIGLFVALLYSPFMKLKLF
ncbi:unnamed protein product [Brassica oleracea var. botrytis]